jgi:hypothetical protein
MRCQPRSRGSRGRGSPVNRADTMIGLRAVRPGVNAGPSTAFGGKPDESGSVRRFHNTTPVHDLRLNERFGVIARLRETLTQLDAVARFLNVLLAMTLVTPLSMPRSPHYARITANSARGFVNGGAICVTPDCHREPVSISRA